MENVEERSTRIVWVKDVVASRNGEQILEAPGIDGIFIGPNDLAFSMLRGSAEITS